MKLNHNSPKYRQVIYQTLLDIMKHKLLFSFFQYQQNSNLDNIDKDTNYNYYIYILLYSILIHFLFNFLTMGRLDYNHFKKLIKILFLKFYY